MLTSSFMIDVKKGEDVTKKIVVVPKGATCLRRENKMVIWEERKKSEVVAW